MLCSLVTAVQASASCHFFPVVVPLHLQIGTMIKKRRIGSLLIRRWYTIRETTYEWGDLCTQIDGVPLEMKIGDCVPTTADGHVFCRGRQGFEVGHLLRLCHYVLRSCLPTLT